MFNQIINRYGIVVPTTFAMIIFAILTVGMATQWTFDLFQPQFLWKAYNHYFLSVLEGHLDIPVESIGREGGYFNSKAYMYYGALPLIVRALLHPFVDLSQTSISYFSVLLFTLIGLVALQISLTKAYLRRVDSSNPLLMWSFIGMSSLIWFGSATFMISQNGTLYHEPYAVGLCLVNIYFALLIKDNFFLKNDTHISLLPYAILAGLCIHARMPTALSLYLVTGILILLQSYRVRHSLSKKINVLTVVLQSFRSFWHVIMVLGLFGLSILWLNYAKYGNPLSFMGGNYGYYFLEGFSERRCNLVPTNALSDYVRIIPNIAVYLTGSEQLHWSLSWHLATGFGRKEMPLAPLLLLWPLLLVCFVYVLFALIKNIKQTVNKLLLAALLALCVGAFFQLKYPTITHRYIAEFWPPLFICLLFTWAQLLRLSSTKLNSIPNLKIKIIAVSVLLLTGIGYQLYLATTNVYYLKDGPTVLLDNYHYSDEDNAFLSTLTPEKIADFRIAYQLEKVEKCAALAEELGVTGLLKDN